MEAGAIVALDYDIDCFVPRGKIGGPRRGPRRGAGEPLSIKLGDVVQVKVIEMDTEKKSLVCSIVREEEYHGHEDSSRGGYNLKHTESDRAYTLGDIPALKNLFKNQGGEIPVEAAPETPTVTETPAAVETPVAAEIPVSAETPSVVETSAVAEAPPVVEIPGVAENSMADDSLNISGDTIAGNVNPEVMNAGVEASAAAENIVQEQLKPDAADADPYEAAINTDNENFASVVESGVADAETPADGEPATDVSDSEPGTEIASKAGSDDEEATKS
jgi:hypothetical protein